jgi:hypothetical protein
MKTTSCSPGTVLSKVRISAASLADAKHELDLQVRAAHKEGYSLRDIAEASSLSHETVRRIVRQ